MPVVKLYRHGLTAGQPPMRNDHLRAPRGGIQGWSEGATRRNTAFLRSIKVDELDGVGFAATLTLRHCPPTPDDWHRLRRAWEMRMARAGMRRAHWVTEWQRRGVPHLHVAIWFPHPDPDSSPVDPRHLITDAWCAVAEPYGAAPRGQHVTPIDGPLGWFQYVSKHASRGVKHYQRNPENIPDHWSSATGKVWGKLGHWPILPAIRVNVDGPAYYALRRMVRSWRIGDARAKGDQHRIQQARQMLKSHDRSSSTVRGISEWIPSHLQDAMLANLQGRGFDLSC